MKKETHLNFDWFDIHTNLKKNNVLPLRKLKYKKFYSQFFPYYSYYESPLDTVLLDQVSNLTFFKNSEEWIVRDGIIPLLWFFKRFPEPENLKSKLYVESTLQKYVPVEWANHIGTYCLFSNQTYKKKNLMILGSISERYFSMKQLNSFFLSLKSSLKEFPVQNMSKLAHLSFQDLNREKSLEFQINYFSQFHELFGLNVNTLTLPKILEAEGPSSYLIVNLNNNILLSDNFLIHYFLSRGAGMLPSHSQAKKGRSVFISEHHGFYLNDTVESKISIFDSLNDELKSVELFFKRNSYPRKEKSYQEHLPWPPWIFDWLKTTSLPTSQ